MAKVAVAIIIAIMQSNGVKWRQNGSWCMPILGMSHLPSAWGVGHCIAKSCDVGCCLIRCAVPINSNANPFPSSLERPTRPSSAVPVKQLGC